MSMVIARPLVEAEGLAVGSRRTAVDLMATSFEVEGHPAGDAVPEADARRVGHIRRIVAARLRYLGLAALCDPTLAIVSELVTNAIEHAGQGSGRRRSVTVTQLYARGQLHIFVKDEGRGQPQTIDAGLQAESGRGLWIVELITADLGGRWGFSPGSRTAWCVLPAPSRPSESARTTRASHSTNLSLEESVYEVSRDGLPKIIQPDSGPLPPREPGRAWQSAEEGLALPGPSAGTAAHSEREQVTASWLSNLRRRGPQADRSNEGV